MSPARLLARALFLYLLVFASGTPAFAQNATSPPAASATATAKTVPAQPSAPSISYPTAPPDGFDITKNASVATAIEPDGHAYYFGQRAGLDGWLLVKGKEVEIVYMTLDRKTFILGNMFGTEGYNITSDQLRDLLHNVPEAGHSLTDVAKDEYGLSGGTGLQANGQPMLPTFRSIGSGGSGGSSEGGSTSAAPATVPAISPGERLLLDLQDANGVDVGMGTAPVIYMIMDPNCPHCKATWRLLRDAVFKNTLRVRLIPIGMNEEDDRASGMLLTVDDPLNAWDKYVAGDKTTLAGTPSIMQIKKVRANHALVDSWSISETPYMAYRSIKTDDMKVIAGEPDHIETIVSDVSQ